MRWARNIGHVAILIPVFNKANSRMNRGILGVEIVDFCKKKKKKKKKSKKKISIVRAMQVPKGGRNQVSGRVSVPCWHAIPVTNVPWAPLVTQ